MDQDTLSEKQKAQETEYFFPYHYLDLVPRIEYSQVMLRRYRKFVLELLAPYTGQSVLDAGCGDGRLCYDMRKKNLKVTGIDYSQQALAFARAFSPDVEFIVGDLTKYRFENQFDAIVLMEVLEHFDPSVISQVLSNLCLSLAENGKLIITVPSTRFELTAKHYQHFSTHELKTTVQPYFEVESVYGFDRAGLKRRICSRLISGDYIFGSLRLKSRRIVRPYYWFVDHLVDSIEKCPPEKAMQIIAVCRKAS